MSAARDVLARRAEAGHPGWAFSHGLYGWTATHPGTPPLRSTSLPGLDALVSATRLAPPAPARAPAPRPARGPDHHPPPPRETP